MICLHQLLELHNPPASPPLFQWWIIGWIWGCLAKTRHARIHGLPATLLAVEELLESRPNLRFLSLPFDARSVDNIPNIPTMPLLRHRLQRWDTIQLYSCTRRHKLALSWCGGHRILEGATWFENQASGSLFRNLSRIKYNQDQWYMASFALIRLDYLFPPSFSYPFIPSSCIFWTAKHLLSSRYLVLFRDLILVGWTQM